MCKIISTQITIVVLLISMKNTVEQLYKSFFLGAIATIVDFVIFSLCNYVFFKHLRQTTFHFGPFNYSIEDGGLCLFLSTAFSYLISQSVNYFVQRKYAFKSDATTVRSFVLYICSSILAYLVILYIPGLIGAFVNSVVGFTFGALVTKAIANFIGFIIQFPINKLIIFKS